MPTCVQFSKCATGAASKKVLVKKSRAGEGDVLLGLEALQPDRKLSCEQHKRPECTVQGSPLPAF